MFKLKIDRCFMFMATIAMAFNLFGNSFINFPSNVYAESTENTQSVSQKHSILDQSRAEEIDFSESEEGFETEREEFSDNLLTSNAEFFRLLNDYQYLTIASSSPFLKPLRSEEIPIYLALQNIRL
jgi:hypothetical protein